MLRPSQIARRCGLSQNKQIEQLCPKTSQTDACRHCSLTITYCALPVLYGFWPGFQISFIFFNKLGMDYDKCFLWMYKDGEHAGSFLFCHQYAVIAFILWKRDRNGKETLPKSGHKTNVEFWLGSFHPLASATTEPCFIHMCRAVKLGPLCDLYCAVCQNKSPPTKVCFPRRTCWMYHEPDPPHHKGIHCLFCSSAFIWGATD